MFLHDKSWKKQLTEKNRTDLKDATGISFNIFAKLGRNEFASMESLYKICVALNCGVDNIVEFTNY